MQKNSSLIRLMDLDKQVKVIIADTTQVVEEARRRHQTSATASAALGRVITAALFLGSELKEDQELVTIRIVGDGMAGPIIATANGNGQVRGLVSNPQADLPSRYPGKLAVGELVGKEGYLEVIRDMGMKQPFIGRVPLVSGEIAEDLSQYFYMSEQVLSLVSLGVLVDTDLTILAAGGLLIQAMPGAREDLLAKLEDNVLNMGAISEVIKNHKRIEDIAPQVMKGVEYYITGEQKLQFKCNCSRERLAAILAQLSDEELDEIYAAEGKLEVCCNFCNEFYEYTPDDIKIMKK